MRCCQRLRGVSLVADIADRLREVLALLNLKGPAAAERADLPYRSLQNYLAGQPPGAEALVKLRIGLGISIDWLLTGVGERLVPSSAVARFKDIVGLAAYIRGQMQGEGGALERDAQRLLDAVIEAYLQDDDGAGRSLRLHYGGAADAVIAQKDWALALLVGFHRLEGERSPQSESAMSPQPPSKRSPKRRLKRA